MSLKKAFTLSISGKGGSGKTTIAILLLKNLIESGENDILLIDADPASNVPNVLGIGMEGKMTLGRILDKKKEELESPSQPYTKLLEGVIWENIIEQDGYDVLVMGRPEDEGCYCIIENFAAVIIDSLAKLYDFVMIDFDAGFEHISRRVDRAADVLLIITDPSKMGFETARRIVKLVEKINISFKNTYLIGNEFNEELGKKLFDFSQEIGIKYGGILPYDQNIVEFNLKGKSLIDLPRNSPAVKAAKKIFKKIFQE
ncbi:MAG: ATP-binding protein [Candidatus Jordarchaeum sp.]|uniref:ATP-binding protein n=1 Tax=Candidatus Jordarchaeum sp. TaxID=2823881 RepID=UPI00404A8A16